MNIKPLLITREYQRLILNTILTEEGTFAEQQLPEDFSGAVALSVEVVFAIVFVDASGNLSFLTLNTPSILDGERKADGPVKIGDRVIRPAFGESEVDIIVSWKVNPAMPDDNKTKAEAMFASFEKQKPDWTL